MVSGHALVQPLAAVQVIFPFFSEVSRYRVCPCPLTRTVPTPGTLLALIVGAADDALAGALLDEPDAVLDDDDPQAATAAAAPTARPANSSRRPAGPGRAGPGIIVCAHERLLFSFSVQA